MLFRGIIVVLGRLHVMTMRNFGMMRGLLVSARLVMLGGLMMMFGGLFMVMRRLFVMFVNVVLGHWFLPEIPNCKKPDGGRRP